MVIKPVWIVYGIGVGALLLLLRVGADRNKDGKADGVVSGLGFDLGRVVPDFVASAADGFLDGIADPFGGSYSDCERFKAEQNKLGIYWACWPSDWPIFR